MKPIAGARPKQLSIKNCGEETVVGSPWSQYIIDSIVPGYSKASPSKQTTVSVFGGMMYVTVSGVGCTVMPM